MRKVSFTYFKSWHNATALLLGLAILLTGFTPGSPPVVELETYTASINSTCSGNVPIQNLANGMDYTITVGAGGAVNITVRVVDNPAGLVGFLGGPGNPISIPNGTGTFTYSLTNQADPYVLNMYFNWAAGGQGSSDPVSCAASAAPTVCTGNVPIQNLANGMNYTITVGAGGTVSISVTVVDNPAGLVGFLGGPGNPISIPNVTGTFTYSLTGQADPYVLNMYFNWAAGGQGNSQAVSCSSSPPTPIPPSQPVGFVAMNPTSSSGFLAVGPNNVGANNIVYRLFYSPTATAPANPLNATQHTFGSIAGDGNGTAAFGFNRGGLTAATQYTFWLYQYNTADMLYSTPAVATLTTLSPPLLPTTNAPNPICPAANVVSIYGDFYSPNIATNYNPNWGQSGFCCVNKSKYNPGTGNVILAYQNFNYQGTELTQTNLSNMQFLNFDVWTDANPSTTTLQVSPINQGTGPAEVLVTVPFVRGQWTRISLPKSAFGGMTWNGVFQMKFEAFGVRPVDIYLDNIFFSTTNCGVPCPSGWRNSDVSTANGSAIISTCLGLDGSFVLTSTGFSTPSSDKLHIAYKEICGNTTVTARVTGISGGGWGGVVIRENLTPGSKKVALKSQLSHNIRREIRSTTNGATTTLNYFRPDTWLRIVRSGSSFTAYSSPDGVTWSFAFSTTVSMGGCVQVGVFSESINAATTTTATFANVSVTGTSNSLTAGLPDAQLVSERDEQVRVFPNPTTGEVTIDLDLHAGKPGTIQVFNALGALTTQERLIPGNRETHRMSIGNLAGVYTVVIQLEDSRIVRRVVVNPNSGK